MMAAAAELVDYYGGNEHECGVTLLKALRNG